MLLWQWCLFKIEKRKWPNKKFKIIYPPVTISTPVSCRWTVHMPIKRVFNAFLYVYNIHMYILPLVYLVSSFLQIKHKMYMHKLVNTVSIHTINMVHNLILQLLQYFVLTIVVPTHKKYYCWIRRILIWVGTVEHYIYMLLHSYNDITLINVNINYYKAVL